MALSAPACKDTQDFQFKVHNKYAAFKKCGEPRSNVNLLAISCSRGLLFAGNPTQPELKVVILKDLANSNKSLGEQPQARSVPLPSVPNYISCSADGTLLAVNLTQNGTGLLNIYSVPTFLAADVKLVYSIRLASEDYIHAVQLLWNPVLPGSLAVVLSNGALGMYTLKEGDTFEMHSLDKSQQVKCGCWSPKGKQIVLGFPGGKIQQFKPDLTPAKTLVCPPNIHDAPFDTIAIQWLSTYQFAVVFLQHGEDCSPALYILNAPKGGSPSYTNYYDICYSLNGPRNHQFFFNHVAQWNLLLVTSANGVEVGIMGTFESGDTPVWQQFTLLDEARIELPLSEGTQEETFPLGSVYDTSSTHQLTINEQKLPTMPMVHVLGTDGTLLSFNFLNLLQGAPSVCSPPPPVFDSSGQFRPLDTLLPAEEKEAATTPPEKESTQSVPTDMSFAFSPNTVTSTPAPAKDKPSSLFSGFAAPAASTPFGVAPTAAPTATVASTASAFGGFGAATTTPALGSIFSAPGATAFGGLALGKSNAMPVSVASAPLAVPPSAAAAPLNKPLYTVPHTFTPVATKQQPAAAPVSVPSRQSLDNTESIVRDMIALQIEAFNQDIQQQKGLTTELLSTIAAPSALKKYAKRLDDLEELNEQAKDVEFELDVQGLRQGLNEAYAIVAECRGKLEVYEKPNITRLMNSSSYDPAGRRMLARLRSYVAANEAQLRLAEQQLDLQWDQLQDVLRRKTKSSMHMPCLEGIYQQLTRLQNLASDQRIMQNSIKAKLKERGLLQAALLDQDKSRTRTNETVETLADSILSMSLSQTVDTNAAKLTQHKLRQIRNVVQLQKVSIISPQRPDRVGLKSEVILETKRKAEILKKAAAKATTANKATQVAAPAPAPAPAPTPAPAAAPVAPQLPKPTASKPAASIPALSAAPIATPFAFSQSSPFVKTSSVTTTTTTVSSGEAPKPAVSLFGGPSRSGLSFGPVGGGLSFGGLSAADNSTGAKPSLFGGFGISKEATAKPAPEPAKAQDPLAKDTTPFTAEVEPAKAPETPKAETAGKSFSFTGFGGTGAPSSTFGFGGLGSSLGFGGVAKTDSNAAVTSSASGVPRGLFASAAAAPKPNESDTAVTSISTTTKPTVAPASTLTAAAATPLPTNNSGVTSTAPSSSDSLGGLFGSVNICKPQIKESSGASGQPANIFGSGFSFGGRGGDEPKGLFATITPATTATATATETPATAAPTTIKMEPVSTTAATTAAPAPAASAAPATTTSTETKGAATPPTSTPAAAPPVKVAVPPNTTSAAAPAVTPATAVSSTVTSSTAVPGSTFSFSNAFSSLSTAPATPVTATSSSASTVSNSSSSVFGGSFTAAPATTAAPVASNPFQASTTASAATSTNLFGNVAKSETSVFGGSPGTNLPPAAAAAPPSGLFAAAAISNPAPFGSPPPGTAASGGNIFSQANKPSVFGQPSAGASGGTSIFGGSSGSPFGSTSIFGGSNAQSPANAPTAGSTSIFGQNVFGQPAAQTATPVAGGNIFASPVSASQQPQPSAFGGGGSIFGGPATTSSSPASGGSIFGGGSSSGFGSFSQTAPSPGGFGSGFAQGAGSSVAQSGFGSPQTPQQAAPGGFGAKPVFGGSPAFGASPTFGGGATFGSPKGFGGFGASPNVAAPPAFGAPAKPAGGNIFDTLGGQDSGLSFGNLAQTGNPNAQKPAFGGSSFMNYR
ncbi:nuclear pore complex protein Nup214 [Drosophila pseudoobscura]|uniref:Nuclear pore complex protein Nup214 n=1 Tax=Drosophila pseudoobscura pseudoobscura TaxID=46245 RepID=A0A6I8UWF7_DROPS|nr:nuclear pore complex protein Nup214 [Drosophila pseudoobscura]